MKDYLSSFELSSALIGFNPSIEKDIRLIEQGCTATLMMTQSPRSLRTLDSLQNIDENSIRILQNRNVLTYYEFLEFNNNQLVKKIALIRPNSLKREDAEKIIKICDEYSLISFLRYLNYKESKFIQENKKLGEQILNNIIYTQEIQRSIILEMILRFESYSIEAFLEIYDLNQKVMNYLLKQLSFPSKEIYNFYNTNREFTEEVKEFLLMRNNHPVLIALRDDFHLLYPNDKNLILIKEEEVEIIKTELEYLNDATKEVLMRLAKFLSPEKDWKNSSYDELFELFSHHPSLQSEESWPGLKNFIYAIENLIKITENLSEIRKEVLIESSVYEFQKKLNMNFEPYFLSINNFEIPEYIKKFYKNVDKEKIFKIFIEKLNKNNELIVYKSKLNENNSGYYIIYKYNIPKAFIENKNRRSFIHIMLKNSNYPSGIYNFILDSYNQNLPDIILKEQQDLIKAIKEWEKEQEKINKKRKTIIQIIIEWFLKLFGFSKESLENDKNRDLDTFPIKESKKKKKNISREYIPEYRLKKIPEKIEKAISFIERQYNGLIWVDELSYVLDYKDIERLNSILYYDKDQRFEEIKPLHTIKPLFIRKDHLKNKEWIENTIHTLKNSSKLPHQIALLEYLENHKKMIE